MTSEERDFHNEELDPGDTFLREQFEHAPIAEVSEIGADKIWEAMRCELHRQDEHVVQNRAVAKSKTASYFTFGNMLAMAASGLLIAAGSIFVVAAKQRRDGIVVSTVTHVQSMMRREKPGESSKAEWLPEEREIWKQLMGQTANGLDPERAVAIEPAIRQK
jgi:hypothetical protein